MKRTAVAAALLAALVAAAPASADVAVPDEHKDPTPSVGPVRDRMSREEFRDLTLRVFCRRAGTVAIDFTVTDRISITKDPVWSRSIATGPEGADLRVDPPQAALDELVGRRQAMTVKWDARCTEPDGRSGGSRGQFDVMRQEPRPPHCDTLLPERGSVRRLLAGTFRIRVECETATTVLVLFDIEHEEWLGIPTDRWDEHAGSGHAEVGASGRASVPIKLKPWARRYVRRARRARWPVQILAGAEFDTLENTWAPRYVGRIQMVR